ncbi:hypothetical protein P6709_15300 [Jeotgalibacillus sp. ET6]|uniref:hypothetical protein n=1 Tax=Jeotgalibacillus sp. ET6 TaxID=3037260 RepID=UPI0024187B08|nr:hypothetical protein [Jeotgalibacillus sp. ET6]MDG5473118.1 hypothetical protein [Jeotgalibacillus sp. ET6]
MLAEIHNKISQSGSNLSDRLEDKLTGDFFGAIRYLPFESGLKQVLEATNFKQNLVKDQWVTELNNQRGYSGTWSFWHREDEGEIDLLLTFPDMIIGIEVKYLSGISSEDVPGLDLAGHVDSVNQLARYSRMLDRISLERNAYLIFLSPYEMMHEVKASMEGRKIIAPSVDVGYLNWEDIHESLKMIDLSLHDQGQQYIVEDLLQLLVKKGLIRFRGFGVNENTVAISKAHYQFNEDRTIRDQKCWNWPTKQIIKEEQSYVFEFSE